MGLQIPASWVEASLACLCSITTGKKDVNQGAKNGKYPFFTCAQEISRSDSYSFNGSAILIAGNGYFNAKKYDGKFEAYQRTYVLENFLISRDYLFYFISHRLEDITKDNFGSTIRYIRIANLTDYLVQFPSLTEQRRIVAKIEELLSELDKGIESLKTAQAQLKVYRQALLKHAFEGKLTAQWRADNPDKLETADALLKRIQKEREQRYQQQVAEWEAAGKPGSKPKAPKLLEPLTDEDLVELPELPEGWAWIKLGNANVEVFDGPFGSNLKSSDYVASGVRVIRLENIGALQFIADKTSFITEEKYALLKDHTVTAGDIIFSSFITESVRAALLPASVDKAVNKADCFCVRVHGEILSNVFAVMFLSTRLVFKRLEAKIHGVGRPRINTTQLKEVAIPICGAAEQKLVVGEIESRLSEVETLEQTLATSLEQAEALRQSILQKAFSGQLVPQDSTDEPASVLLARIKAEQSAAPKAKKARK